MDVFIRTGAVEGFFVSRELDVATIVVLPVVIVCACGGVLTTAMARMVLHRWADSQQWSSARTSRFGGPPSLDVAAR